MTRMTIFVTTKNLLIIKKDSYLHKMKEYFVLLGGNKFLWGQLCKLREFGNKLLVIAWNNNPNIKGDLFLQMDIKDKDGVIRKGDNSLMVLYREPVHRSILSNIFGGIIERRAA